AEQVAVEGERLLQVAHPDHGVQEGIGAGIGRLLGAWLHRHVHALLPMTLSTASAARRLGGSPPRPSARSAAPEARLCAARAAGSTRICPTAWASSAGVQRCCSSSGITPWPAIRLTRVTCGTRIIALATMADSALTRYPITIGVSVMASSSDTVPEAA